VTGYASSSCVLVLGLLGVNIVTRLRLGRPGFDTR